jgi:hypothetical protein
MSKPEQEGKNVGAEPVAGQAEAMLSDIFGRPRDLRSEAYKAGVLAVLKKHFDSVPIAVIYRPGTAERDAFFSGCDEGRSLINALKLCTSAANVRLNT